MHYRKLVLVWPSIFLFGIIGIIAPSCRCFDLSSPIRTPRLPVDRRCRHRRAPLLLLNAANDGDETTSTTTSSLMSSSTSLYQPIPTNKPWTFGILTSGFPPQQLLVPVVKFFTFQVWRLMMNELVTHDEQGRFVRESFQVGNNPAPLSLPNVSISGGFIPRYKLYLGNPCPWCHRVKAAMALLKLEHDIPITMLIDNAEKASKGGWILPGPTSADIKYDLWQHDCCW